MPPSTLKDSLQSPLCPPSPNGFQGVNPGRRTITDRNTTSTNKDYNNQNNNYSKYLNPNIFLTPKKIIPSPPRNASYKRHSLPSPPSMSPIRTCAPRTVISPRTHTSPRYKISLRSPPKHFRFDNDGTQKSVDEIARFRDIGPCTVQDKRTEYCGRYLLVPAFFQNYFPLLNESYGNIRISVVTPTNTSVVISENDYDEIPKKQDSDDSYDSDNDDIKIDPTINTDVEISTLGAVFVMAVSGIFLLNLATGSS